MSIKLTLAMKGVSYMAAPGIERCKYVPIELIELNVCSFFQLSSEEIKENTRKKYIREPRQIAMYFAAELSNYSYERIGKYFGNKDHATVVHARKAINNMMDTDKKFKQLIISIKSSFKS